MTLQVEHCLKKVTIMQCRRILPLRHGSSAVRLRLFMLAAWFPFSFLPSESASLVVLVRSDDSPMTRPGVAMVRVSGPGVGSWWPGTALSGSRSGWPLRPSGLVALRARLSATVTCVGGGVVSFNFVVASRSESLRSRVPLALRRGDSETRIPPCNMHRGQVPSHWATTGGGD